MRLWPDAKAFLKRLSLIVLGVIAATVTLAWAALLAYCAIQLIGWAL